MICQLFRSRCRRRSEGDHITFPSPFTSCTFFTYRRTPPTSNGFTVSGPFTTSSAMATRFSRPFLRRVPATCPFTAPIRTSATPLSARTFASATTTKRFDESLLRDFRRWLKSEVALLVCLAAAGAAGVHLYQVHRPNERRDMIETKSDLKRLFVLTDLCFVCRASVRAEP